MFPILFRIGPLFIAELILLTIAVVSLCIEPIFPCVDYTFVQLAIQIYLAEIILVFRLIRKNKKLRSKYLGKIVFADKKYFRKIVLWNSFCVWGVILALAFWMIKQGLTVSNSQLQTAQKIYTLYPLCYFSDMTNHPESGNQFGMVMNFLYACNVIMNLVLISLNVRQFYVYIETIKRNRNFFLTNSIQFSESLLDCKIIEEPMIYGRRCKQNEQGMECGICLRKFCRQKVMTLRCSHNFHEQCINLWLKVKDECPYRCI